MFTWLKCFSSIPHWFQFHFPGSDNTCSIPDFFLPIRAISASNRSCREASTFLGGSTTHRALVLVCDPVWTAVPNYFWASCHCLHLLLVFAFLLFKKNIFQEACWCFVMSMASVSSYSMWGLRISRRKEIITELESLWHKKSCSVQGALLYPKHVLYISSSKQGVSEHFQIQIHMAMFWWSRTY